MMFLTLGRDATAQPAIRPYGSLYKFHLSVSLQCYFFFVCLFLVVVNVGMHVWVTMQQALLNILQILGERSRRAPTGTI